MQSRRLSTKDRELAGRLKAARLGKRLSQEKAAEQVGIARQTLIRYEGGTREPTAAVLASFARAYEVSVPWLLGLDEEPQILRRIRDLPERYVADVMDYIAMKEEQVKRERETDG